MKNVKICPECGCLVYFNYYFGAYICENCEWEDASYAEKRASYSVTSDSHMMQLNENVYQLIAKRRMTVRKKVQQ